MKCQSCQANIDTKWKNAIEKNECPFCGKVIMDNELKAALVKAKKIIDQLMEDKYRDSFVDWIRSNYSFILSNQKLTNIRQDTVESVKVETPKSKESEIFARAKGNLNGKTKEERLTSAASALGLAARGASSESMIIQEDADLDPLSYSEIEGVKGALNNHYGISSDPDDEGIPQVVLDMARNAKSSPKDYNAKDVFALQKQFDAARKEPVKGKGSFSRG